MVVEGVGEDVLARAVPVAKVVAAAARGDTPTSVDGGGGDGGACSRWASA